MKQNSARAALFGAFLFLGAGLGCDGIKYVPEDTDGALPEATASPRIVFAELSHDFGTVPADSALAHTFTFTNRGGGVLQLQQPKGS